VFEGKLREVMRIAKDLGIFDHETTTLYGIPKSAVVRLKGNWINLFDHLTVEVKKLIDEDEMAELIAKSNAYNEFHYSIGRSYRVEETITSLAKLMVNKNGLINELASLLEENKNSNNHDNLKRIAHELNIKIELATADPQVSLADTLKKIYNTYPMLTWPLETYNTCHGQQLQHLVDYVNMIDETAEKVLDSE